MVKIIYPFLLVPLKSLIRVMACFQLDDKLFPELILKSMTPYHVSWAQKVEVCQRHVILDGNKILCGSEIGQTSMQHYVVILIKLML